MFNPQTLNSDYDYGDLIPIREFIDYANVGGFIDSDGFGYLATASHHDDSSEVYPSTVKFGVPKSVTHIFWFNN